MNKYVVALIVTIVFVVGFFLFRAFVKPDQEIVQKKTTEQLLRQVNKDSKPISEEDMNILLEKVRNK